MKTLHDLERNDVDGAMEVYVRELGNGKWKPERSSMLLMLQDDPSELMRRMAAHDRERRKRRR